MAGYTGYLFYSLRIAAHITFEKEILSFCYFLDFVGSYLHSITKDFACLC
jgi:hypothetical protein